VPDFFELSAAGQRAGGLSRLRVRPVAADGSIGDGQGLLFGFLPSIIAQMFGKLTLSFASFRICPDLSSLDKTSETGFLTDHLREMVQNHEI
jgi:hypothetical protein